MRSHCIRLGRIVITCEYRSNVTTFVSIESCASLQFEDVGGNWSTLNTLFCKTPRYLRDSVPLGLVCSAIVFYHCFYCGFYCCFYCRFYYRFIFLVVWCVLDVIAFLSVASPICGRRSCFVSIARSPVVLASPRGGWNGWLNIKQALRAIKPTV